MVAAAVVFPRGVSLPAVNDSKKLTAPEREELERAIRAVPGVSIGIGEVSAAEIDQLDILRATWRAMRLAVEQLGKVDFILVDGRPVKVGSRIERYNFINNLVVKLVLNFAFDVCKIKNHTVFVKSFTLKIYVNYPVVTMKIRAF